MSNKEQKDTNLALRTNVAKQLLKVMIDWQKSKYIVFYFFSSVVSNSHKLLCKKMVISIFIK